MLYSSLYYAICEKREVDTVQFLSAWKNTLYSVNDRDHSTGETTYTYSYDSRGNITSVSDGINTTSYVYDSKDQLLRENNQAAGKTWVYAYDDGGNIL